MIVCQDAINYLKSMKDKSVDAVVTSPPYNIGIKYDTTTDDRGDYVRWTIEWLEEALRVSRKGVMLNIGGKASDRALLYKTLGAIAVAFDIQNSIIWAKSIFVDGKTYGHFKPINSDQYVNNTFEYVLHIVPKKQRIKINKLAVGVPFEFKQNIDRFKGNDGKDLRCRGALWFIPYETRNEKLEHPATYSIELAEMMIKYVEAESVIDPFMGSGTTSLAAYNLNVNCDGCDISANYVHSATMRLSDHILRK